MIPKFRCWDKEKNEFIDDFFIDETGEVYAEESSMCEHGYVNLVGNQNLILMQSTGLKDKNGVEIYEGDIVEVIWNFEMFTGVVVYDQSEAGFKATNGKFDYGTNFMYLTGNDLVEVIGNIHENKELLEVGE